MNFFKKWQISRVKPANERHLSEIPIIKIQEKAVPERRYLPADSTMQDKKY